MDEISIRTTIKELQDIANELIAKGYVVKISVNNGYVRMTITKNIQ